MDRQEFTARFVLKWFDPESDVDWQYYYDLCAEKGLKIWKSVEEQVALKGMEKLAAVEKDQNWGE